MSQPKKYLLDIRPGERMQTLLLSLNVLTIVAAYTMIKTVRDAVFLAKFGLSEMAFVMIGLALSAGTLTAIGTRMGHRLPLVRRILATHTIVAASLIGLWMAFGAGIPLTPWVLYVWSSFFGLFVLANFWLLANELHDTRSAKRLFAILGAGAICGGIVGGELSRFLAPLLGAVNLLPVIAVMLVGSAGLALAAWRASPRKDPAPTEEAPKHERAVGFTEGLHLVKNHPHLRLIATMLILSTIATTLVDMQVKSVAKAHFASNPEAMAAFFGRLASLFSVVSLAFQLLLTSRILKRFGVGLGLLALPMTLAIGAIAIGLHPMIGIGVLTAATIAKVGEGGVRFSLDKASMELLYLPVPSTLKSKAKPLIDTVADRIGTAFTGMIWLGLTAVAIRTGATSIVLAAGFTFVILAAWVFVINRSRHQYIHALRKALVRRHRGPEPTLQLEPDTALRSHKADFERLLTLEARTYQQHLAALRDDRATDEQRHTLMHRLHEDLERIFRVLGLRYPKADVQAAYTGLLSDEASTRASAVELLDNLFEVATRRQIIPLLENHASESLGALPPPGPQLDPGYTYTYGGENTQRTPR